jgi:uncharacterized coiled-coil protein SlyX
MIAELTRQITETQQEIKLLEEKLTAITRHLTRETERLEYLKLILKQYENNPGRTGS